jgi:hypothetical protein
MSERHALIKPASLIARDENEALEIGRRLGRADGDLLKAQDIAIKDRAKALEHALREKARRRARRVDILELELGLKAIGIADYEPAMGWEGERPSARQLAYISRAGIDFGQIRYRGEAYAVIELLEKRRRLGLATFKQARLMRRLGHPWAHAMSFGEASAWLRTRLTKKN